jgi:hypothetical protein
MTFLKLVHYIILIRSRNTELKSNTNSPLQAGRISPLSVLFSTRTHLTVPHIRLFLPESMKIKMSSYAREGLLVGFDYGKTSFDNLYRLHHVKLI